MKIYCDKCHENISSDVDVRFDKLLVGHVVCPKCHKENKRYISETDLLMYLAISEVFYLIISTITMFIYNKFLMTWISIIVLVVMFVIAFIVQKQIDRYVYKNAYGKQDLKYKEFKEDKNKISKSLIWQSMLYLALAITYATSTKFSLFFFLASILAASLTFVKFKLSLKKEKESIIKK